MVVEPEVPLVVFRGVRKPAQLKIDVAELFERARRARIERGGGAQVAQRRGKYFRRVSAALMRLAALQIRQHGLGFQRDGAAVGLDGDKRLSAAEGLVPLRDERQ